MIKWSSVEIIRNDIVSYVACSFEYLNKFHAWKTSALVINASKIFSRIKCAMIASFSRAEP